MNDTIVQEVRKIRAEIVDQFEGNIGKLIRDARARDQAQRSKAASNTSSTDKKIQGAHEVETR